jgi:hypothetical protein
MKLKNEKNKEAAMHMFGLFFSFRVMAVILPCNFSEKNKIIYD